MIIHSIFLQKILTKKEIFILKIKMTSFIIGLKMFFGMRIDGKDLSRISDLLIWNMYMIPHTRSSYYVVRYMIVKIINRLKFHFAANYNPEWLTFTQLIKNTLL